MFGFDERYSMFDVTPLENQFILEFLPEARGDYVKVYLYGLLRCYHPEADMNLDRMSHELGMTEDEIAAAFRYWERRGIVRRISDHPPAWEYVNIKQRSLSAEDIQDPEYIAFSNALYDVFDNGRRLHGAEIAACFEWMEDLKLPTEVIIMLLKHMAAVKGKNFRMEDAGRIALQMAEEDIRTMEGAEDFLSRDKKIWDGTRKILRKLGKRYYPSEAQADLYRKWVQEWHFTHEAIEEAAAQTAKGDPSMGYLDGILNSMRRESSPGERIDVSDIRDSRDKTERLRSMLRELGKGEINDRTRALYDEMEALYPHEVILLAAHECGLTGSPPEKVLELLKAWKEKGFSTEEEIRDYIRAFHEQTSLLQELSQIWGGRERLGKKEREYATRWKEMGMSRELILTAAEFASEAKSPMAYLNSILMAMKDKGITTPDEARRDRESSSRKPGEKPAAGSKTVRAQEYSQRDYAGRQEKARARFEQMSGGDEEDA